MLFKGTLKVGGNLPLKYCISEVITFYFGINFNTVQLNITLNNKIIEVEVNT